MTSQTVIWTALPNGVTAAGRLRLSVFVSPRLQTDEAQPTLSLFPDFHQTPPDALDWPAHVQSGLVTFRIEVFDSVAEPDDPDTRILEAKATIVAGPLDRALWHALFDAATPVTSHEFKDVSGVVSTNPVSQLHGYVKDRYLRIQDEFKLELPGRVDRSQHLPELHDFFASAPPDSPSPGGGTSPAPSHLEMFRVDRETELSSRISELVATVKTQLDDEIRAAPDAAPRLKALIPGADQVANHFAQLMLFHQPSSRSGPTQPHDVDRLDEFHTRLTALNEYPEILRRLGLVIDLELDDGLKLLDRNATGLRSLRVVPTWTPHLAQTINYSPKTAFAPNAGHFFPASRFTGSALAEMENGMLRLGGGRFELVQVDVDGAALKLAEQARADVRVLAHADDILSPTDDSGIPTLRTAGVSIARRDTTAGLSALNARLGAQRRHNQRLAARDQQPQGSPTTLFAEDVTRGYRVDVFDAERRTWQSLHQRAGIYPLVAGDNEIEDEGCLQLGLTRDGDSDTFKTHHSLCRWDGWSLSVPRPGSRVENAPPPSPTREPPAGPPPPVPAVARVLEATFKARSLPRLRIGRAYQFRARVVNLAGGGLTKDEADQLLKDDPEIGAVAVIPSNQEFVYGRFEPVSAPVVVLKEPLKAAESPELLVLRSGDGAAERHIAPPKTFQQMAETLGRLDAEFGTPKSYNISRREKGSFNDNTIVDLDRTDPIVTLTPQDLEALDPQTMKRAGLRVLSGAPGFVTVRSSNPSRVAMYTIHPEAHLEVPYLPDPLARGAAFRGLPGVATATVATVRDTRLVFEPLSLPADLVAGLGSVTMIDFGPDRDWPDLRPFRLRLEEGEGPPDWNELNRVLTVQLPKGEAAKVRLSSFVVEQDLSEKKLGMWNWVVESRQQDPNKEAQLAPLAKLASLGALWLLTPFHDLKLVHAVQRPVRAPVITSLTAQRIPSAKTPSPTNALLSGVVQVHGQSTIKLDLMASWKEPEDRPDTRKPPRIDAGEMPAFHAHVFEVPVNLPGDDMAFGILATYDATHDVVQFPPRVDPVAAPGRRVRRLRPRPRTGPGPVPIHTDEDGGPDIPEPDQTGPIPVPVHEFGDTRHRQVEYQFVGTTRFSEFFPDAAGGDATNLSLAGPAVAVSIPSSARPPAPKVLYVVPTFRWIKPDPSAGSPRVRRRFGGGLRVYLERPWFASGEGELLGVVLARSSDFPPSDGLAPLTTQWGHDPVWGTAPPTLPPDRQAFRTAESRHGGSGLTLDRVELSADTTVDVVGYPVQYDVGRDLYFSDIEIDPKLSYCPFVRLALVRFQPSSISGAELSHVVLADFAQLVPDRTVTLTANAADPNRMTIKIDGVSYDSNNGPFPADDISAVKSFMEEHQMPVPSALGNFGPVIRLSVQERMSGTLDDMGWGTPRQPVQIDPEGTEVTLPIPRAPGQFRLVIQEFERFHREGLATIPSPPDLDQLRTELEAAHKPPAIIEKDIKAVVAAYALKLKSPGIQDSIRNWAQERLVFADTIEL
jgi:hypothetical protein